MPPGPSRFGPPKHWRDWDTHVQILERHHSFKEWETAHRSVASDTIVQEFSQLLTLVLIFLAEGNKRKKTLGARAWVLLYAIRPDLIDGESMTQAAKAFGYASEMSLVQFLGQLRDAIPALHVETNGRRGYVSGDKEKEIRSEHCRLAALRKWHARKTIYREKLSA